MRTGSGRTSDPSIWWRYSIAWEVPIVKLTATTDDKKNYHYHAYLLALVKNEQGDIVERVSKENGRVMATQKSTLPFPDASGAVPMAIQAASGPGEYEVRVTVQQNRRVAQRALKYSIAAN